ncbi:hypothetical protein Hanom_Chr04g00315061 [Helianthus anomalus]
MNFKNTCTLDKFKDLIYEAGNFDNIHKCLFNFINLSICTCDRILLLLSRKFALCSKRFG